MNPADSPTGQVPADFSEYVRILLSHRRLIVAFVGLACVVAVLLSLVGPQVYRAEVTLLPEESSSGIELGSLARSPVIMDLFRGRGGRRDGQVFLEMLTSRSVMEGVIRQAELIPVFKLEKLPEAEAMEKALTLLDDCVAVSETDAGILSVKANQMTRFFPRSKDKRLAATRAAAIANAFAAELNRVNREKSTSRARSVRQYLEKQIAETEGLLRAASDSLASFQIEHKAVSLEEQTKAALEGAGELRGLIVATEVELGLLRRSMQPDNMMVRAAEAKLEEMRRQYEMVQYGDSPGSRGAIREFLVPFADLPDVAKRMGILLRDVRIQETVYELLTAQYYEAKIQETRDVPSLSVLDSAIPPVQRHWPKRKLLLLSTGLVSVLVSALIAFGLEYRDRRHGSRPPEITWGAAWNADKALLRGWMRGRSSGQGAR
jgi:uncharacterized protein involved in exopolysaccharide biosynthesis